MIWLYASAAAMVVTAFIHSWAGEKRLIGPLLDGDNAPLDNTQSRKVLRSAWHLTSGFMVLCAVIVISADVPVIALRIIGGFWLVLGLFSLVASRGRHVGWPTLTASGLMGLIGAAG